MKTSKAEQNEAETLLARKGSKDRRRVVWWFEAAASGELVRVFQDFPGKQSAARFLHRRHSEGLPATMALVSATPWHNERSGAQ